VFITFEGLDGSGKTTQTELLRASLAAEGRDVVATREPGGTELGERVREILLRGTEMSGWAEAALFTAARAELVARVIAPTLERGSDVLADRYVDSSLAYQGIGRGLGVEEILELNLRATGGLLPDRTFLLLLDADEAARRSGDDRDRIERAGSDFHDSVDRAYRELARMFPERVVALDGARPEGELAAEIRDRVRDLS
jgi:dTMP kinase